MKNTLLAIGAHPDDMDFGASATVAKFSQEGWRTYYIIATDGSRGSADAKMTHKKLSNIRKTEQKEAGKVLGLSDIFFLDHTDTQLEAGQKLKEQIVRIIRTTKPKIVITMDPVFHYTTEFFSTGKGFINHTDHRAVGLAAMDACFPLARDRLTFPQHEKSGLAPHKVEELWFVSFDQEASHIVDVTDTLSKKIKALSLHKSQFDNLKELEKNIIQRASFVGKKSGYKYGEAFKRIVIPS